MKVNELNTILRELFTDLMANNYKKNRLCDVVLGTTNLPQFESFMKGNDFGVKPLTRLLENIGYELELIPVQKKDQEAKTAISILSTDFVEATKFNLLTALENCNVVKSTSKVDVMISDAISDLIK